MQSGPEMSSSAASSTTEPRKRACDQCKLSKIKVYNLMYLCYAGERRSISNFAVLIVQLLTTMRDMPHQRIRMHLPHTSKETRPPCQVSVLLAERCMTRHLI